ncbi:hypothetical protein [Streptomyces lavendulae]|uniref:hypothetical protein n=1 Tax=Streptomyces lavendulae TaxID=1914 RepID=UPI00249FDF7F|nr:hypothetical protein [Streptomyces lavendulae]GLX19806.1 hypothetical protein Slala01_34500 [Streptomyces lavendulae subsp. lavendulae]
MRRSISMPVPVPAALAVVLTALAATAGCGGPGTGERAAGPAKSAAGPATSSAPAPVKVPPLSQEEARGVVKDVTLKVEADNFDAGYWRGVTEGPLLEQQLAVVETAEKYGTDREARPADSPATDPAVHTWSTGKDDGSDRWILGAHEVQGYTVGDAGKEAVLRWSLFHQQKAGAPWLAAFVARAPEPTDLPQVAVGPDGRAVTGGDTAGLAADPAKVCGQYGDHMYTDGGAGGVKWSQDVAKRKAASAAQLERMRTSLGKGAKVDFGVDVNRGSHGPVWRTTDGGALVACTAVSKVYTDLGPGRSTTFSSSGWAGTAGVPWATYTQRIMGLTVLKVSAGAAGEVSVAAESNLPYSFDGTKYTG